jgi:hypothetical protein
MVEIIHTVQVDIKTVLQEPHKLQLSREEVFLPTPGWGRVGVGVKMPWYFKIFPPPPDPLPPGEGNNWRTFAGYPGKNTSIGESTS